MTATPYSALSRSYDRTLGPRFLRRAARAYHVLERIYGWSPRVVADLGAGTGLFAAWLARRRPVRVYAVDRSRAMLEQARRNVGGQRVTLLEQDVRSLALPELADLAVANFDTVNHLLTPADVQAMFRAVAANLRRGGWLVFDAITPCQAGGRPRVYRFRAGSRTLMAQRVAWDPDRRLVRVTVWVRGERGARREYHLERAYHPARLGRWLHQAGFTVRGLHDARTLASVGDRCPPRVVLVARRRLLRPASSASPDVPPRDLARG